ncbi:MAG: hypothetical protein NWP79_04810, partial [Paracoccaceae bacterium]|nr:hypothetical protein [Paracoccaceae bacterium]
RPHDRAIGRGRSQPHGRDRRRPQAFRRAVAQGLGKEIRCRKNCPFPKKTAGLLPNKRAVQKKLVRACEMLFS